MAFQFARQLRGRLVHDPVWRLRKGHAQLLGRGCRLGLLGVAAPALPGNPRPQLEVPGSAAGSSVAD